MVLGTVTIHVAWHPAIDAGSVLARETRDAIETCRATRRSLDAAHAFVADFHALALRRTVRRSAAGTAATEHAVLDRNAVEAVAP
jgi:hypothetical protein